MYSFIYFILFLSLLHSLVLHVPSLSARHGLHRSLLQQNGNVSSCPLDFDVLRRLIRGSGRSYRDATTGYCQYISQGLRLVQSEYLRTTGSFLPPLDTAESCWDSYQALVDEFVPNTNIRRMCGFQTAWIAEGCMNITTRAEFEGYVSRSALNDAVSACNRSLGNSAICASCTTALSGLRSSNLTGPSIGNISDCTDYLSIYAAAVANRFGPTDLGTAFCLFSFDFSPSNSNDKRKRIIIAVVVVACSVTLILGFLGFLFYEEKGKI